MRCNVLEYRRRVVVGWMCVLMLAVTTAAQNKLDFSGAWQPDAEKNQAALAGAPPEARAAAGARSGLSGPLTITMTASRMTVARTMPDGTALTTVYALDGSPSRNQIPGQGEVESIASVDGSAVVIRSKTTGVVQRWFLEGKWLVYERAAEQFTSRSYYIRR